MALIRLLSTFSILNIVSLAYRSPYVPGRVDYPLWLYAVSSLIPAVSQLLVR